MTEDQKAAARIAELERIVAEQAATIAEQKRELDSWRVRGSSGK